mmetsp:Transcript_9092/g.27006  ORF Transcript_9092/g.27006 Transcript_9092/m.27006 type:complete len:250 (-) Transcript_9092:2534-3283(-)
MSLTAQSVQSIGDLFLVRVFRKADGNGADSELDDGEESLQNDSGGDQSIIDQTPSCVVSSWVGLAAKALQEQWPRQEEEHEHEREEEQEEERRHSQSGFLLLLLLLVSFTTFTTHTALFGAIVFGSHTGSGAGTGKASHPKTEHGTRPPIVDSSSSETILFQHVSVCICIGFGFGIGALKNLAGFLDPVQHSTEKTLALPQGIPEGTLPNANAVRLSQTRNARTRIPASVGVGFGFSSTFGVGFHSGAL